MVSAVLDQVTGQLDQRFVVNALFPVLIFGLGLGLALAVGTGGVEAGIGSWEGLDTALKTLIAIGAVGLVFVCANILASGMQGVVRLFEGYLPSFLGPVASWARNARLKEAAKLLDKAAREDDAAFVAEDRFQRSFPVFPRSLSADRIAATRLGNVLRSAETYSRDRYGVDSVRIWPRLYALLPEDLTTSMTEARSSMEFLLAVAFLAGIYAPLASIYLVATSSSLIWVLSALLISSLVSLAAYLGALAPAAVYGDHIRVAFDLHRFELLAKAGVPLPATPAEEHRTWAAFIKFLEFGKPHNTWRYVLPK
jgi:hypothetical protein